MKRKLTGLLALLLAMAMLLSACTVKGGNGESQTTTTTTKPEATPTQPTKITGIEVSDLDVAFLKAENAEVNKVYSPLSIKYALNMLAAGTAGASKQQIVDLLAGSMVNQYLSGENLSLANALFIRDAFRDGVKQSYIDALQAGFGADVIFDPFTSPATLNDWVKGKTLGLIPNLLDTIDPTTDFALVNALGIDMEWKNKFCSVGFDDKETGFHDSVSYNHEDYWVSCNSHTVESHQFADGAIIASCLEFFASMDNYDIVSILGEDNIRQTVGDTYREWIAENGYDSWHSRELSDPAEIEAEIERYLDEYIADIKANYTEKGETISIDFSVYTDDTVKVFAKDLKTYNGTTLQYVGIMPTNEDLDEYVSRVDGATLQHVVENLKDLKRENFEDGVITRIKGFVPKFKMEYDLSLMDDLKAMGVTDVFDGEKADLSALTDAEGAYISEALHKANVEFTQDGIKAAAASFVGGKGAGGPAFDYIYDVPIVDIDLTFDRPFMFLIRDKDSGDVWFMGTVYDPLHWDDDLTREEYFDFEAYNKSFNN